MCFSQCSSFVGSNFFCSKCHHGIDCNCCLRCLQIQCQIDNIIVPFSLANRGREWSCHHRRAHESRVNSPCSTCRCARHRQIYSVKRPKLRIDADTDDVYLRYRVRFVAGTTVASGQVRLQPCRRHRQSGRYATTSEVTDLVFIAICR